MEAMSYRECLNCKHCYFKKSRYGLKYEWCKKLNLGSENARKECQRKYKEEK